MKKRFTFVGNAKECYHRKEETIQVLDRDDLEVANVMFKKRYLAQINHTRKRINASLKPLYRVDLLFSTSILSEVVGKIHYILDTTNAPDIKTVAKELRDYIGWDTKFFRKQGLREIPCESERIAEAYVAMKRKLPRGRVRSILFN